MPIPCLTSAQRLSASNLRTQRFQFFIEKRLLTAQRLSASNLRTLTKFGFSPIFGVLLNAYRHLILEHRGR